MEITCKEAIEKLVDYICGNLESDKGKKIAEHIKLCKKCCDKLEFEEKLRQVIREKCLSVKCPDKLRTSIMERLKGEEQQ